VKYVNEGEKFWKHSFRVHLSVHDTDGILVNADNAQDALDYAVDYAEKQGWEGLFVSEDEVGAYGDDEITRAGNHGRALLSDNIRINVIHDLAPYANSTGDCDSCTGEAEPCPNCPARENKEE
jgi:hypothetical protein